MHAPHPHSPSAPPASPREPLPTPSLSPSVSPSLSPDDKERIETWFEHDSRLTEVANQLGIGVLTLAAWAKQPHIKEALLDICEIARFRTETLRAEAEHASVNRLLSIVRYSNHEEIARRAAANILGQGLRPARTSRATGLPPGAPSSPPPPRDPPTRRDEHPTPSIPTPRVPTPPIPPLPPTTPKTPTTPFSPAAQHSDFQIPHLELPSPRPPRLRESPSSFLAPLPCLSVSVPPCQIPSTPLQPTSAPSASPREPLPSSPFPVPVPRPAPRQYHERNHPP